MLGLGNSLVTGGAIEVVLPSDISNLGIWFKNDTGITESSGSVSQWADSSGNDRHAVQSGGTQQAQVSDGGLDFSSADPEDFYQISSSTSALIDVKHPNAFTLAVVLKREGGTTDDNVLFSTTSANTFIGFLTNENTIKVHGSSSTFTGEPWANNEKLLVTITKDTSGNLLYYKNAIAEPITGGATASTDTGTLLLDYFGCTRTGVLANDKHFDGVIYELVVYTSALTGSDLSNLNSYLRSKFGL